VDLGPEGPNPLFLQSISVLWCTNALLIAPQCPHVYLFSIPTWRPFVCAPVPCSHPCLLYHHADSRPSYRCLQDHILIACACDPAVPFSISSSPISLYFLSSIIISLIPIEHCSEDYLASILLIRRGLRCWDTPQNTHLFPLDRYVH